MAEGSQDGLNLHMPKKVSGADDTSFTSICVMRYFDSVIAKFSWKRWELLVKSKDIAVYTTDPTQQSRLQKTECSAVDVVRWTR